MSFSKKLIRSTPSLLLILSPYSVHAETEEAQKIYVAKCSDAANPKEYCQDVEKGKDGVERVVLRWKNEVTVGHTDAATGAWTKDGTKLQDHRTNKKDIYQILGQTRLDPFAGLKNCKDKEVRVGEPCISKYDFPRNENSNPYRDFAKVPVRIGQVSAKRADGTNQFSDMSRDEVVKYLLIPKSSGGGGFAFTTNPAEEKDPEVVETLASRNLLASPESKIPAVVAKAGPTEPVTAAASEGAAAADANSKECASSAKQYLYPKSKHADPEIQRRVPEFLELQSRITNLRLEYAYLNQASKKNPTAYYKEKSEVADQITELVHLKVHKYPRLHTAFEQAELTNRTDALLAEKKFDSILANQSGVDSHLAIGKSDLKFLTWSTEGATGEIDLTSPSLKFSDWVSDFLADSSSPQGAKTVAAKRQAADNNADAIKRMLNAKVGCEVSKPCAALDSKISRGSAGGNRKNLSDLTKAYFDKATNNEKVAHLRGVDDAKSVLTSKERAIAAAKAKEKESAALALQKSKDSSAGNASATANASAMNGGSQSYQSSGSISAAGDLAPVARAPQRSPGSEKVTAVKAAVTAAKRAPAKSASAQAAAPTASLDDVVNSVMTAKEGAKISVGKNCKMMVQRTETTTNGQTMYHLRLYQSAADKAGSELTMIGRPSDTLSEFGSAYEACVQAK